MRIQRRALFLRPHLDDERLFGSGTHQLTINETRSIFTAAALFIFGGTPAAPSSLARTGHADRPHPALGQDLTPSHTHCHIERA
jgi:hypothetical protein